MKDYQQRVVDERADLCGRLGRLRGFMDSVAYEDLPQDEKNRLRVQERVMSAYDEILRQRIEAF